MPTLTQQQMDNLQAEITANDIPGFYALLESYGDSYGRLGAAVTDNNTWQGELANAFAAHGAQNNSVVLDYQSTVWLKVNKELAQAYLDAYDDNSGGEPTRQQVQDAHNLVYQTNGLDSDDWLPNKLLNDSFDPDALWTDYLTNDGAGDLIEDAWNITKDNLLALTLPPLFAVEAATDMDGLIAKAKYSDNLLNALLGLSESAKTGMASDFTGTDIEGLLDMLGNLAGAAKGFIGSLPAIIDDPTGILHKLLPGWVSGVVEPFEQSETTASPLVLDLAGTGVNLAALGSAGSVYWNISGGDFANASGWIAEGSGLLAIDLNEDGIINDHSELFGTLTTDGFSVLGGYDSDSDDDIDANDDVWEELLVWTDDNSDGYSQADELHTLDGLLITSINLNATQVSYDIAGNAITHESTFTIDGNTHDIVDAWFAYDTVNTVYASAYDLDVRALFLPTLRGYGNLPDLHIAMSLDETLLGMVEEIATTDLSQLIDPVSNVDNKIRDVMFRWAGVDDVEIDSRGQWIDARVLEFLEAFMGEPWVGLSGPNPVGMGPTNILFDAWSSAFNAVSARLVAQSAASQLFLGDLTYNSITDSIDGITGVDLSAIATLSGAFGHDSLAESALFWTNILGTIDKAYGLDNIGSTAEDALDDIIQNDDPFNQLSYALIADGIQGAGTDLDGDSNANMLVGGSHASALDGLAGDDILIGSTRDDSLRGDDGADILIGGTGWDYLYGEAGDDTYVFRIGDSSGGQQQNFEMLAEELSSGTDKIQFLAGINPEDVYS